MKILALNCGSSSVKYQLYDWKNKKVLCKGLAERIGKDFHDHSDALSAIFSVLTDKKTGPLKDLSEISAVGHRVLNGGTRFQQSTLIDNDVLGAIKEIKGLGPLHIPANVLGIEASQKLLPNTPNVAVFDTAFHQTMPPEAYLYAVPYEWFKMYGVRRYGFHGSSHLYVSKRASVLLDKKPSETNLITIHIGNGVSLAAIKDGVSIDTSMGLTPLEGAIMGTRSGDLDPAIIIFMIEKEGFYAKELDRILNYKSGLLGITGKYADRRDIERDADDGDERCRLAIRMEAYRLKKYIGAYMAAIGRLDAIVFTGGAGELNPGLREKTACGLEFIGINLDKEKNKAATSSGVESLISAPDSKIKIFVIPTNEEIVFVEDVVAILENRYNVHTDFTYSFQSKGYKIG